MFKVVDSSLLGEALPPVRSVEEIELPDIDIVVACLGYEDRTNSAITSLAKYGVAVNNALIWNYPGSGAENERNRAGLVQLLEIVGASVSNVQNAEELKAQLELTLAAVPRDLPAHIVVDLSAMSGLVVLACIGALRGLTERAGLRVTFLYAEAEEYGPSEAEFSASQEEFERVGSLGLDEGVLSVTSGISMRGSHDPRLRDLIVVIPGFSRDRVRSSISALNPALLLSTDEQVKWTVGVPHYPKDRWREAAMRRLHGVSEGDSVPLSTFQYAETYSFLESTYENEWVRSNINIVFLGSKLQALAVGLFCAVRGGIRLVLSTPEAYRPTDYSAGTRDVWAVEFSDWFDSLSRLGSIGTVSFAH